MANHLLHGGQDTSAQLVDESGALVEQYEYDPYGEARVYQAGSQAALGESAVGLPFLWKGLRVDSPTRLVYMRNRYFAPGTGRFLTADPIGVWGDRVNLGNGYAYAGERPLVQGDPLGLYTIVYVIVSANKKTMEKLKQMKEELEGAVAMVNADPEGGVLST